MATAGATWRLGHAKFREAEFTGTYYATTDYGQTGREWAQERFARYLAACGHEIGPASVKVEVRYLMARPEYEGLDFWGLLTAGEARFVRDNETPGDKPQVMTASARVLAPVLAYPRCGNWTCIADADWAEADPVDDPAVYAGVAAEQAYVEQLLGPTPDRAMPHFMIGEMMAAHRRRAEGKPLWTIDIRPPAPGRM